MLTCIKCKSELDDYKGKYICSNEECGFAIKKSEYESMKQEEFIKGDNWCEYICSNSDYWHEEAFHEYPSVVAHEYERLFELLKCKQTYGMLLQLKDTFEVILKFPVLICISEIYGKHQNLSSNEKEALITLLQQPLALGHWYNVSSMILKTQTNDIVRNLLNDVKFNIYDKYEIVNWRNNEIGHGALNHEETASFKEDIIKKLLILKDHFIRCRELYSKINFYRIEDNNRIYMSGKNNARSIEHKSQKVFAEIDGENIELYPYIHLNQGGIYFFDTYYSYKDKTYILNYPDGKKDNSSRFLNEMIKAKVKELNLTSFSNELSLDEKMYSNAEEKIFNKIQEIDDFEKPTYLLNRFRELLSSYKKGVFLLRMERGTGKSTFARALDELSIHQVKLKDFSVRSYYINDTRFYKVDTFEERIVCLMKMKKDGQVEVDGLNIHIKDCVSKKEGLARVLNEYRKAHELMSNINNKKLLLIIDGLDEIPHKEDTTIFDYIPNDGLLDDNVYIVLTARTEKELEDNMFITNKINQLELTDSIIITRMDNSNKETLTSYIKKNILFEGEEEYIELLLEKSEFRFLYLKALKEMYSDFQSIDKIPEGSKVFNCYLKKLENMYGPKYFSKIINTLLIISTAAEPLTTREICYLLGEEKRTFRFLAFISDLRGLLNIERSYRENLISISHSEWKKILEEEYFENICSLIKEWCNKIDDLKNKTLELDNEAYDGELYLLSNIMTYLNNYNLEADNLFNQETAKFLMNVAQQLASGSKYIMLRKEKLYSGAIEVLEYMRKENMSFDKKLLMLAYINHGICNMELGNSRNAIVVDFKKATLLLDANDIKYISIINIYCGAAYYNLNDYYNAYERIRASKNFDVYEMSTQDWAENHILCINAKITQELIAGALRLRRVDLKVRIEALEKYMDCMYFIDWAKKEFGFEDAKSEAEVLLGLGDLYQRFGFYKEAIEHYSKSIILLNNGAGKLDFSGYEKLAKALLSRSKGYKVFEDLESAVADYKEASKYINILEEYQVFSSFKLSINLRIIGYDLYNEIGFIEEAEMLYEEIKRLKEKSDLHKVENSTDLLIEFYKIQGDLFYKKQQCEEAVKSYTMAINYNERKLHYWEGDNLANLYASRSRAFEQLGRYQKALEDRLEVSGVCHEAWDLGIPLMLEKYITYLEDEKRFYKNVYKDTSYIRAIDQQICDLKEGRVERRRDPMRSFIEDIIIAARLKIEDRYPIIAYDYYNKVSKMLSESLVELPCNAMANFYLNRGKVYLHLGINYDIYTNLKMEKEDFYLKAIEDFTLVLEKIVDFKEDMSDYYYPSDFSVYRSFEVLALMYRGIACVKINNNKAAVKDLEESLFIRKNYFYDFYGYDINDIFKEIDCDYNIRKSDEDVAETLMYLGDIYFEKEKYSLADEYYDKAIKRKVTYFKAGFTSPSDLIYAPYKAQKDIVKSMNYETILDFIIEDTIKFELDNKIHYKLCSLIRKANIYYLCYRYKDVIEVLNKIISDIDEMESVNKELINLYNMCENKIYFITELAGKIQPRGCNNVV